MMDGRVATRRSARGTRRKPARRSPVGKRMTQLERFRRTLPARESELRICAPSCTVDHETESRAKRQRWGVREG